MRKMRTTGSRKGAQINFKRAIIIQLHERSKLGMIISILWIRILRLGVEK